MTSRSLPRPGHFRLDLPAKIAGIVFWGMVLVGLLISAFLLQIREDELAAQYRAKVVVMARAIEQALDNVAGPADLRPRIAEVFDQTRSGDDVEAVALEYLGQRIELGHRQPGQDIYREPIRISRAAASGNPPHIDIEIYLRSLKQAVAELRKKMLVIIGSVVFLFGLILQQILQRVLSRPFLNMVLIADRFAGGDNTTRFDEQRVDEFGYLGKFINRALDAVMRQQRELEDSRLALFEEKERAEVTLHSITDGVISTDAAGHVLYMNPVAERLCETDTTRARDQRLTDIIRFQNEETGADLANPVERCLLENAIAELPSHGALVRRDSSTVPIEASAAPMRNDEGRVIGAVLVLQDVSHARRLTRQLSYQATHDALTGLYNRSSFEEHVAAALRNVQSEGRHHAMCYIDLDQFKIVNDTCGHIAGDELLRQLAVLLHAGVREGDILARLGGDEFGVLLENCPLNSAVEIANKIRQRVKDFRFVWKGSSFEIGASIGLVAINSENVDIAGILAAADLACYAAKEMGRNRVHVYEPTDAALAERHGQMHWAARILRALEEQRLVLFRQPVLPLQPGAGVQHWEVLLRMKDDNGGYVYPEVFIPAAERYNLISKIDQWVIEKVFSSLAPAGGNRSRRMVAINLSGNSLADDDLLPWIRQQGRNHRIDFSRICFEITETAAIRNLEKAAHFMNKLHQEGCRFSLDDFGSGLSSFGYLKNLPVDFLKIDGGFVKDMSTDPIDRAMVEAITRVGHVMQIQTIAESVENAETLSMLRDIGVDFAQGYHVGRPAEVPMPAERTAAAGRMSR